MLERLKTGLARALRRAAYSAGAGLCFLVGAAFLTVAGWVYLVETTSTTTAALIVGSVWFALGFCLLGIASLGRSAPPARKPSGPAPQVNSANLVQAFLFGFDAGQGTARRK